MGLPDPEDMLTLRAALPETVQVEEAHLTEPDVSEARFVTEKVAEPCTVDLKSRMTQLGMLSDLSMHLPGGQIGAGGMVTLRTSPTVAM